MTRQQRRKRRLMRRRIASLVTFCVIVAAAALIICALTNAAERDTQQPDTATVEKTSAVIKAPTQPTITSHVERDAQPPEQEEAPPEEISRYADLNISEDDIELLAALVYHEARGECFDGQVAVIEVVLNRCLSPEFPDTVEGVVFQKYGDVWQFSPVPYIWTAEPTQTQYDAVYTAINSTDYVLPVETVFFGREAYNENVVAAIGNHVFCSIEEVTQ